MLLFFPATHMKMYKKLSTLRKGILVKFSPVMNYIIIGISTSHFIQFLLWRRGWISSDYVSVSLSLFLFFTIHLILFLLVIPIYHFLFYSLECRLFCWVSYINYVDSVAFEFLDDEAMVCTSSNLELANPLDDPSPFYVLIETHGSVQEHDMAKLEVVWSFRSL